MSKPETKEAEAETIYTGAVKIHMDNLKSDRQQRNTSKEFIQQLMTESKDFQDFSKTGLASKVNNL